MFSCVIITERGSNLRKYIHREKEADMSEINIKDLQKEMKSLGIINIEADGDLSPSLLKDAVEAVKETNLDFAALAEKAKTMAAEAR